MKANLATVWPLTVRHLPFQRVLAVAVAAGSCLSLTPIVRGQAPPPPAPAPGAEPGLNPSLAKLEPFEGRPIREVRLEGVRPEDEQLVRNQLRVQSGQPLRLPAVEGDLKRVNRLGRFKQMTAKIQPFEDESVVLIYVVVETPVVKAVQAVGNRQISDQDLAAEVDILVNTPIDPYAIDRTLRKIRELYKKKGYYQADVTVDQKELDENNILLFRIREGERLKVTDIRFEGNEHIEEDLLRPKIKTETWGLFYDGVLDEVVLDQDLAEIIKYYKDRGYLDVRADRRITPAPNGKEAIITFIVVEGPLYTLRSLRFEAQGNPDADADTPFQPVFTREQIAGLIPLKSGEVYSVEQVRKSVETVQYAYGRLGYADVRVNRAEVRDPKQPVVDLLILVREGRKYKTGVVEIVGDEITQQKVIRRQVQVLPDRPLDTAKVELSKAYIDSTRLFAGAREQKSTKVTVQAETPDNPGYRDVVVEVAEKNTASIAFGVAASSDGGLIGSITLDQSNFDLMSPPESWDQLVRGKAFRGAGQHFNITIAPGTEVQNYTMSFGEPYMFESDYSGDITGGMQSYKYDYDSEQRVFVRAGVARRFGDRWTGALQLRAANVTVSDIEPTAPTDYTAVEGTNLITGVKLSMQRTTTDVGIKPTRGAILRLGLEQAGALGGSYNFTQFSAEHQMWLTLNEDVLGRKTVLSTRTSLSYIPQGMDAVPIYERAFQGGRGFRCNKTVEKL